MDSMLDLFLGDRIYDENGKLIKRDFCIKNILAIAVVVFVGYSLMGKSFSVPTLSGKKKGKKMKGKKMKGGVNEMAVHHNKPIRNIAHFSLAVAVAVGFYGIFNEDSLNPYLMTGILVAVWVVGTIIIEAFYRDSIRDLSERE